MSEEDYSKAVREFCKPAYEHQLNYYAMIVEKRLRNENPFTSEEKTPWYKQADDEVRLDFDLIKKSGLLASVTVAKSTGTSELDNIALAHLQRNLTRALPLFPEMFPEVLPFRVDYSCRGCGTVRQMLTRDHFDMDKDSYAAVVCKELERVLLNHSTYTLVYKQLADNDLSFGMVFGHTRTPQLEFFTNDKKHKKVAQLIEEKISSCNFVPLPEDFPSEIRIAITLRSTGHLKYHKAILSFELTGEDFNEIMSSVSTYRD